MIKAKGVCCNGRRFTEIPSPNPKGRREKNLIAFIMNDIDGKIQPNISRMKMIETNRFLYSTGNAESEMGMHYGAHPLIFKKAEELRNKMTYAEELLWTILK